MYDIPAKRILWFTGSQYEQAENTIEKYIIYQGLPDTFDMIEPFDMVVLDDLMNEIQTAKHVSNLFTRMVHHTPCTVNEGKRQELVLSIHSTWFYLKILEILHK